VIAEFDATVQEAELTAARSRLRTARAAAGRAERLLALGAASRGEQEEAATALREAQGQLRAAEARVAYGAVRSPFDGVVTALRVDAGDVVGARQEIAVVGDLRELRAVVPVSELDVVRLRDGAPVRAAIDAVPGRDIAARVRRVFPTVDPVTRQGVVEVEVPRSSPSLRPGLLARLTFTIAEVEQAIAVPLDAVRRDVRDRPYVYVVQDVLVHDSAGGRSGGGEEKGDGKGEPGGGKAKADGRRGGDRKAGGEGPRRAQIVLRRSVRIGLRGSDNWVQLLDGVRVGDRVVVSGEQELGDSTEVRIAPPARAARSGGEGATSGADGGAAGARAGGSATGAGGAPASAEGGASTGQGSPSAPAPGAAAGGRASGGPTSPAIVGGEAAANARGSGRGSGAGAGAAAPAGSPGVAAGRAGAPSGGAPSGGASGSTP
jgi:multidrug efflux pump subunit AcrA (membrane-fusion protein)